MKIIFLENDAGGTIHVFKNQIRVRFSKGYRFSLKIDTRELLNRVRSRKEDEWETDDFLIEPMYTDTDGAIFVIITFKKKRGLDKAVILRSELYEALMIAEDVEL